MPNRSSKRPRDANQLAKFITDHFSAPEHPVSLPHTRHNEMVVVKVWVWAGSALAALLVFYGFYLVLR